ncbi:proline--tRNA ligase [Desulfolutivibrio sulfoxidireducens]|uniref:proline--tRNA ligase n=1 Tax=Desulfolutivibrio sulfoxidireducens TaxID=2773299 RepID=UPI00159D8A0F|nr:proline--tRNA ligase [Desulfolutivibrio sulfoxidireducens]QLA17075.1 proline--tRNA ligase [Desulfolutivibrio sulfoxidireducens]QLA20643.1 proline--tRNA ligase [Desulfolutivibrio sulfoxidireducens]
MRLSTYYAPTLKEDPADAEVVSHKLLLRAGMIRKLTAGVYTYLPLGLRALNNVAAVVREEMNRAGALEVLMPAVQPGDLWKESGRWDVYGKELLRFIDRHDRESCLGPTHEEVVTDLVRHEIRSYRQLPLNLYQIQTKFRDEIRPRFGLMRGREFIMKDAYSFDKDDAGADTSYFAMYDAYARIFTRLGLTFRAVEADSGPIGGSFSHEFMVLAATGEDTIAACSACEYGANLEKAEAVCHVTEGASFCPPAESVPTPGVHTVEQVAEFLGVSADRIVKTLLYVADGRVVAALVRGDRELNEVKLKNVLGATEMELASPEVVTRVTGAPVGFAGPVGLSVDLIYADKELAGRSDWIVGANAADAHLRHVDLARDATIECFLDLRQVAPGDLCPKCGQPLVFTKGIEVGHVFKLGTKYSKTMGAMFLDEEGKERPIIMGCYGIGVSRVVAACLEQNHDEHGIVFPPPMAPFEVALLTLSPKDEAAMAKARELHDALTGMGVEVLLDDRDERPGVKFKDADLMGFPIQLVLGGKGLARGVVETKDRRTGEKGELPLEGFAEAFMAYRQTVREGWEKRR